MRTMQSDTAAPSRAYSVFFSLYASSIDYRWNPSLPGSTAERQQLCPVASASSRSAAFRLLLPRLLLMVTARSIDNQERTREQNTEERRSH
ncbi:D-aminoacyl-tRNA deacylase [Trichinella spiralis]|uniref:D-aminoacyl-tRNA deacylase n=1 Tax=Trichinella spiralis TaxID=6334 RepID=A0ABR3KJI0_TRISP